MTAKRARFDNMYAEAVGAVFASHKRAEPADPAEPASMAELATVQVAKHAMQKAPHAVLRAAKELEPDDRALLLAGLLVMAQDDDELDAVMAHLSQKRQRRLALGAIDTVKRPHPELLQRNDLVVFRSPWPEQITTVWRYGFSLPYALFAVLRSAYAAHHDPNSEKRLHVMHDGSLGFRIDVDNIGPDGLYEFMAKVAREDTEDEVDPDDWEANSEDYEDDIRDKIADFEQEIVEYLEHTLLEGWHTGYEHWHTPAQGMLMSRAPALTVIF